MVGFLKADVLAVVCSDLFCLRSVRPYQLGHVLML